MAYAKNRNDPEITRKAEERERPFNHTRAETDIYQICKRMPENKNVKRSENEWLYIERMSIRLNFFSHTQTKSCG